MIYFIYFVIFLFFAFNYDFLRKKGLENFFYILEAISLILLATLRFRVGGDSLTYEDNYEYLPTLNELFQFGFNSLEYQPLWYVLNALIRTVSDKFVLFQFVHALIINIPIFIFFHKYCKHKFTMVLFYFVFIYPYFNFEVLRESIAVVIFLFALPKIFEKKYFTYYVLIAIAFLFHASAIFLFFIPLIIQFLKKDLSFSTLFIISILVILSANALVYLLINYLPVNEFIINKLELYSSLKINFNGIIMIFFQLTPIICIHYLLRKTNNTNQLTSFIINIYIILTVFSFTIAGSNRIMNYFKLFFFVILVESIIFDLRINYLNNARLKLLSYILFLLMFVDIGNYYVRDMTKFNSGNKASFYNLYYPYNSVFYPMVDNRRENIYYNSMYDNRY